MHDAVGRSERMPPGRRVRQHGPEAEDVAGRGERCAAHLLRRHEARRSDRRAGMRHATDGGRLQRPCDAEVDDPRPVDGDQDIGRLEVAVDDSGGMDRPQSTGQSGGEDPYRPLGQRGAAADDLLQGRAGDIARGDPGGLGLGVRVQHGRGPLPADLPRGPHLPPEARPELLLAGQLRTHQLDRDRPAAIRTGQEHPPHAALAEPPDQAVVPDPPRILRTQWRQPWLPPAPRPPLLLRLSRPSCLFHDRSPFPPSPPCGRGSAGACTHGPPRPSLRS